MTDTERGLLRAVCAEPGEDTPRLMYADWLDEHGRGARAEFIREQIAGAICLLRLMWLVPFEGFFGGQPHRLGMVAQNGAAWAHQTGTNRRLTFTRGFVSHVTCSPADWLAHGDNLVASHPIESVSLIGPTDWVAIIRGLCARLAPDSLRELHWPANRDKPLVVAWLFEAVWKGVRFHVEDEEAFIGATIFGRPVTANYSPVIEAAADFTPTVTPPPQPQPGTPDPDDAATWPDECETCGHAGNTMPFAGWQTDPGEHEYLCADCYDIRTVEE